ncbi:MAG: Mur ligase family protein, partial [Desulfobaccales bacterium]
MPATFTAADIAAATRGTLVLGCAEHGFVGVSTDSRTCQAGELFVPLRGERHDGHDYIPKVLARGVRGVVVENRVRGRKGFLSDLPKDLTVVAVADTLEALGDLARAWRRRFAIPVVSLTGSCGKTTAKEMMALILSQYYRVLKNDLNLNNLIGLPQTLLQLDSTYEAAVVEMGMNRFGEIRRLTEI